jgi:divalent metal cation (Fe/Co/Zn/Cd) transporter
MTTLVIALKTLSLVMGGLVTYFAYRASARTGSPALRALAAGFGVVTLGALLAGAVDQVLVLDAAYALTVESATATLGFGVILYSLYAE